ncbi:Non-classical phosphatidylinositol transfer protein (PITP) [Metarhizium rileyi]|uniref:Phosphatidylinositol transfer protein SFH5 n=1 Tax=Metarhizium rileyi (strain RCEF 4871) TaxID=1649241 RepID=A0A5C6GAX8_METRR|nr:Non-classical phosphatidylinositol transfer protein (PITP) [Metarhizium rileyi]
MTTEQALPIEPAAPVKTPAVTATATAAVTPPETEAAAEMATPAAPETPLTKLTARLPDIISKADYKEMWGVDLSADGAHAPTQVILLKFLRANNNDVAAAEKQLASALEWRKKMQPGKLASEAFDKNKFGDLGFVTVHKDAAENKETVITWNIYGAVKDNKATFGNVQEFIRWRAALMELGIRKLRLNQIKEPLALDAPDPHQMLQVHDYLSVSFFRMDPSVKAASKETIDVFSMAYPELLAHKYFVNVPAVMGWMFGVMKLFLAPATLRKFHPMTSGASLAAELKGVSASLPKEYGGQGPSVKEGETLQLVDLAPKEAEADKDRVASTPAHAPSAHAPAVEAETADEVTETVA